MAARQWQGCEFAKKPKKKPGSDGIPRAKDLNSNFDAILRTVYAKNIFSSTWTYEPPDPRIDLRDKAMRIRYCYMRRRDDQVEP